MGSQCCVRTSTIAGVTALPVDVEVDVGAGLPSFTIVGLPDLAIQEARERVRSAIRSSGFDVPNSRIVVNLAPGPLRKHGTGFDLPIALGLLAATGQVPRTAASDYVAVGELSLDGSVRRVPGMLAHCLAARDAGLPVVGPSDTTAASEIESLTYLPLTHLRELRSGVPEPARTSARAAMAEASYADFSDVVGQDSAIRALVVSAVGGHDVLMIGPPGAGKTMLARRVPGILPPLTAEERLATALVHSVAGIDEQPALDGVRPFRAPHHSASVAGLVGGGSPPRPGEASLAHNGVLFLDEMPEFGPAALQCLRQPLEDGVVTLVRAEGRMRFPARFVLIGAANPCPCGFLGDSARQCTCAPGVIERYAGRIGGPLMDRIDMVVDVARPDPGRLLKHAPACSSAALRRMVLDAREYCRERGGAPPTHLSGAELLAACRMRSHVVDFLEHAARTQHLSGRGITRLLRVARTLADLEGRERVDRDDLGEALGFRVRSAR